MLSNCGVGEASWESLEQQGDPVNPKGDQPWIFIGRTDAEAPILWPPDAKNWLIGKDPDAGKDQRQEKGTEDEMVGWHYRLNGHEFEQTPGYSEGQGSLMCYSPWGFRVRHDWETELNWKKSLTLLWVPKIYLEKHWKEFPSVVYNTATKPVVFNIAVQLSSN